jgi:hypothetical protein
MKTFINIFLVFHFENQWTRLANEWHEIDDYHVYVFFYMFTTNGRDNAATSEERSCVLHCQIIGPK